MKSACGLVGINSLWPGEAIWRHKSGSAFVKVLVCCLLPGTAPSQYLDPLHYFFQRE